MRDGNGTGNKGSDRKAYDELFYRTPGAWHGCGPDGEYGGHIVVDANKIIWALAAIRKSRRFEAIATEVKHEPNPDCTGILIRLKVRGRE